MRHRHIRTEAAVGQWGRRRLLGVLAATGLAALLLLAGLGYAVRFALTSGAQPAAGPGTGATAAEPATPPGGIPTAGVASSQARRDALAAAPMLSVRPADARPQAPAADPAPAISIPPATAAGPAGVPTGFPHTPEGAVGQLAAIETTVLQAMSIPATHDVHAVWALPGGVEAGQWSMTRNVQAFLAAARMGPEKDTTAAVMANPAGAQVKGADGPDWVLACVLLEVRAAITAEARIGYGHCERMQWQPDTGLPVGGRWMIGPGAPPAPAPSTWPGTVLAAAAGWRTWAPDVPDDSGVDRGGIVTSGGSAS